MAYGARSGPITVSSTTALLSLTLQGRGRIEKRMACPTFSNATGTPIIRVAVCRATNGGAPITRARVATSIDQRRIGRGRRQTNRRGSRLPNCGVRAITREISGKARARRATRHVAASTNRRRGLGPKGTRPLSVLVVSATARTVAFALHVYGRFTGRTLTSLL